MLERPVTMETYVKKFSTMLNVEEIQMEVDIRKYDMEAVTMTINPQNKRLLLLEVSVEYQQNKFQVLLICLKGHFSFWHLYIFLMCLKLVFEK